MLLGNGSVLHKSPLNFRGGSTTSVEPQLINNYDKSGPRRNRLYVDQRTTALKFFAVPTGYYAQTAWFLPQKSSEISSHERARLTVSQSGLAVGGITTTGTATLSITPADLIGQLISSGSGTAAMSISVANLLMTASISGAGSSAFTIAPNAPLLGALASGYGTATMTITGALNPYAIGSMSGSTVDSSVLTVGAISASVWEYVNRTLTSGGSGGPTAAEIAADLIAALQATTIPVNMTQVRGQAISGSGSESDPWGP